MVKHADISYRVLRYGPKTPSGLQKYTNVACVSISNLGLRAAERHDPGRQHEGAPGPYDYPDGA